MRFGLGLEIVAISARIRFTQRRVVNSYALSLCNVVCFDTNKILSLYILLYLYDEFCIKSKRDLWGGDHFRLVRHKLIVLLDNSMKKLKIMKIEPSQFYGLLV